MKVYLNMKIVCNQTVRIIIPIFFVIGLILQSSHADTVDDLIIMTEQYPPYNFEKNGQAHGIAPDTLVLMLKKVNSNLTRKDIKILPWARGYNETLQKPKTCLFSTTRTKERETLFKWVGPVGTNKMVLTAKKENNIVIQSKKDLKKYKIGVILEDVVGQLLKEMDFGNEIVKAVPMTIQTIKKLDSGRIDLWGYGEDVSKWELKRHGFDPDRFETVYTIQTTDLYFAFHKDTDDQIIELLQSALDQLKEQGEYLKIVDSYLK